MENNSSPERLHGMLIAQASLLNSLIRVLPPGTQQALLSELKTDTEFLKDFLLSQALSEAAIEACEVDAQANLNFVSALVR